MKIAIHKGSNDFSEKWIEYCKDKNIQYKIVDCYRNDIVHQVVDCDALMWHFNQSNPKDFLFAKQLIYALQSSGKRVFPDFNTAWHFDDKVGQKYLLEAVGAPLVPSYVFYDKQKALEWIEKAEFPKVFKLRKGAGSSHVKLVRTRSEAREKVNQAFSRGFSQYDKIQNLKDRWYKFRKGKISFNSVLKGILRLGKTTTFAKVAGPENGYIYFQDFIPGNNFDIRVVVIDGKAFAIKRMVRDGDFRASGSGHLHYDKSNFDEAYIQLSFDIAKKIQSQCLAIDYVFKNGKSLIVEISYGFIKGSNEGYWDRDMNWHQGPFNAQGWMVESLIS